MWKWYFFILNVCIMNTRCSNSRNSFLFITRTDGRYAPCARLLRGSGVRRLFKSGSLRSLIERGDIFLSNLQTPLKLDRKKVWLMETYYLVGINLHIKFPPDRVKDTKIMGGQTGQTHRQTDKRIYNIDTQKKS